MPPQAPLHETLHQVTRSAHRRLERRMESYHLKFGLHNYRRLLQDIWGFYQPLERKLVVLSDHLLTSPYSHQRLKAPRLEQDLLSLGMTEADIAALPLCGRLPAVPSQPRAVGVLYVLEDAAETGRIAGLHLCDMLGINPSQSGSFFSGSGPHVEQYEQECGSATTTSVGEPCFQTLAVEAALDTFNCFEAWLDYRHRSQPTDYSRWTSESDPELARALHFDSLSGAA
jgi:heme oxygenase